MTHEELVAEIKRVCRENDIPEKKLARDKFRELSPLGKKAFVQKPGNWTRAKRAASGLSEHVLDQLETGHEDSAEDTYGSYRAAKTIRKLRREKTDLLKRLELSEARQEVLDALGGSAAGVIRLPGKKRNKKKGSRRVATAVALASDWHVEERVDPCKVNGLNSYDMDIAARRIDRMTDGILWLIEKERTHFDIDNLVLWLGGDLMTGYIHPELVESNALGPIETVLWLQKHISHMIRRLLAEGNLERIDIPCSYGNHGRTTEKSRICTGAENSYEWLMYNQLAALFEGDSRVTFHIPKGQLAYLQVHNSVIRFTHGDTLKSFGLGMYSALRRAISAWDTQIAADVTCIGHVHVYQSLPYYVTNGSLIGYGPYALSIKAPMEPPRQAFFLIDSERGKCSSTPIWVD